MARLGRSGGGGGLGTHAHTLGLADGRAGKGVNEDGRRDGEMWGDVGRCGEMWGDVGRCGERLGDVERSLGSSSEVQGRSREIRAGGQGRPREITHLIEGLCQIEE